MVLKQEFGWSRCVFHFDHGIGPLNFSGTIDFELPNS